MVFFQEPLPIHFPGLLLHSGKLNIEMENGPIEDVFPIENRDIPASHVYQRVQPFVFFWEKSFIIRGLYASSDSESETQWLNHVQRNRPRGSPPPSCFIHPDVEKKAAVEWRWNKPWDISTHSVFQRMGFLTNEMDGKNLVRISPKVRFDQPVGQDSILD